MKTVGIIGGLGPETTAEFYLDLIFSAFQLDKSARPPILIWNVPLEYKIEKEFITTATGIERYIPYLIDAAKRLETGGADFVVIPCNSVHIFIDEVRRSIRIPVLSIVKETTKFLKENSITDIGFLATKIAIDIYTVGLKQSGVNFFLPSEKDQKHIGIIINNLVRSRHNDENKRNLLKIIDRFKNHSIKHVLLACTDLQLIVPHHPRFKVIDTMKIFVDATVREILKR